MSTARRVEAGSTSTVIDQRSASSWRWSTAGSTLPGTTSDWPRSSPSIRGAFSETSGDAPRTEVLESGAPADTSLPWQEWPELEGMEIIVQRVKRLARELAPEGGVTFSVPKPFSFSEDEGGVPGAPQVGLDVIVNADSASTSALRRELFSRLAREMRPRDIRRLSVFVHAG